MPDNVGITSTTKLLAALDKAKLEFKPVIKDAENPGFRRDGKASKYADLNGYIEATEESLHKHGLIISQLAISKEGYAGVTTILFHVESGEFLQSELLLPLDKNTAQGAGSAITYARRYAYAAILGLAAEDDDGNAASGVSPQSGRSTTPRQQTKATPVPNSPYKPPLAAIPADSSDFKAGNEDLPEELFNQIPGTLLTRDGTTTSSNAAALPTPEEQQQYYDRAGELAKVLENAGLKASRGLPIKQKVKKFILARAGVSDLTQVSHLNWQSVFAIQNFKPEEMVAVLEETISTKEATA
jgi:hypothetical protein